MNNEERDRAELERLLAKEQECVCNPGLEFFGLCAGCRINLLREEVKRLRELVEEREQAIRDYRG